MEPYELIRMEESTVTLASMLLLSMLLEEHDAM